jgi:hypothetical protein
MTLNNYDIKSANQNLSDKLLFASQKNSLKITSQKIIRKIHFIDDSQQSKETEKDCLKDDSQKSKETEINCTQTSRELFNDDTQKSIETYKSEQESKNEVSKNMMLLNKL